MLLSNQNMPDLSRYRRSDEQVRALYEYVYSMHQEINHVLQNLDEGNFGKSFTETMNSLKKATEATENEMVKQEEEAVEVPEESGEQMLTFADVYPVGSMYLSSSNTNPSETFGGTWELVDKEFKPQILSGEEIFTINTTNVSELTNAYCVLSGHNLHLRIYIKNKVAFGEAALQLGTVHFANIGVTRLPITVYGFGASDALNGPLYFSLNNTSGVMTHYDLQGEGSTSTEKSINYHIEQEILPGYMLDSFCSKFYWKRTA